MKHLFQTIYCIASSAILFSCGSSDPVPIDYSAELEQVAIEANLQPGETMTTIDLRGALKMTGIVYLSSSLMRDILISRNWIWKITLRSGSS